MIDIIFTEEEKELLHYERFNHPHPRVQEKMEVVYLKSQGLQHKEIQRLSKISKTTLCNYLKEYKQGGIERLKEINFYKPESELNEYKITLEAYFREKPPRTTCEAQAKIEELTGIKRSPTQVRNFLKAIGMSCRKVGFVPGKANISEKIEEQEVFKEQKLQPLLQEAKEGKRFVFFVDAAHFVYGTFLGYIWCFCRLFILSPAGRKRFNVLGALNPVTNKIITVVNEAYINSQTICQLLYMIAQMNIKVPITIILDNARYQRCQFVQQYANSLKIELLFLPSYSPNLNLIERYWKFVKKHCLYSKYYSNFSLFKSAIQKCLKDSHKKELDSLLTWNFQSFKKVQIVTV